MTRTPKESKAAPVRRAAAARSRRRAGARMPHANPAERPRGAAAEDREHWYAVLFDRSPVAVALTTVPEGALVEVNSAFLKLFGYGRKEVLGKTSVELGISSADQRARAVAKLEASGSVRDLECVGTTKSGAKRTLSLNMDRVNVGGKPRVLTTVLDVTDHLCWERTVAEAHERLGLALEAAGAVPWGWDIVENRLDDWTPQYRALYGLAPDAPARYETWLGCIHPEDRARVEAGVERLLSGRDRDWNDEFRIEHPELGERWLRICGRMFQDASGRAIRLTGIQLDITPRKEAEAALRESEAAIRKLNAELEQRVAERTAQLEAQRAQLRAILDATAEGIVVTDERGVVLSANAAALRLFGYEERELIGENVRTLANPPDRDRHDGYIAHYVETGRSRIVGIGREVEGRRKDGSGLPLHVRVTDVRLGDARAFVAVLRDLTEQQRMEGELRARLEDAAQMRRLYAVGELAGLLAHQLNQPLAAIRSRAEAGLARLRRDEFDRARAGETLEHVVQEVDRAAQTIRDLRAFLSRQPQGMVEADVNAVARAACELMGVLAREAEIGLKLDLAEGLRPVRLRPAQIEQVIVSLLRNAIDAILEANGPGGTISVQTAPADRVGAVAVTVRDSGPGLDAEGVRRAFEPLHTTKKDGIGLGLSIARTIVEDHGGRIWAEPGAGGCFRFTLPVAR